MNRFSLSDNERTDIRKLAFDASAGITRDGRNPSDMSDAIRNKIVEVCGGTWDVYSFLENKYKVFAIMREVMPIAQRANLAGRFENFMEIRDVALGEKIYFTVEDNTVYPVLTTSRGNQDIERNNIRDTAFTVATTDYILKFYEEIDNFIRGNMDLGRIAEKANLSMNNKIGELAYTAIYDSYSSLDSDVVASGVYDADTLTGIIENVKLYNSVDNVQIFGTTTALANISDAFGYSDSAKDRANNFGYYGEFRGTELIALPQGFTAGTTTKHVNTSHILVLPASEKIVKVVFEGDIFMNMSDGMDRNDLQPEFIIRRKIGVAAITAVTGKYGFYKFT